MKKQLLFFMLILQYVCTAQTFLFDYDDAGNQTRRYISYSGRMANPNTENQTIEPNVFEEFKYYPNPVKEELILEWQNNENKTIQKIELYNLQGKLLQTKTTETVKETSISFKDYAMGMYILNVYYSDNSNKSIKILKD
jgi:Secretion system C-terminal sorting domain